MNSFNVTAIVLDPGVHRRTQTGTIMTMRVADHTGSINVSIMNPEYTELFKPGDILKFRGAYTSVYQGGLTLGVGKQGECKKTGEFMMIFSETPDISAMPLPAGVRDDRGSRDNSRSPVNRYPR
uniref:OB domain-containing protein n=1 Tax=Caenorhabditis japonica TaxID=281687 RepID=A0A8R1IFW0_CAEJA